MKKTFIALTLVISISANIFAGAFNSAVDDAAKQDTSQNSGSSPSSSSSDGTDSLLVKLIAELIFLGWYYDNFSPSYYKHPYMQKDQYFMYRDFNHMEMDSVTPDDLISDKKSRFHRFSADTSVYCMNRIGLGNETRFEGIFYHCFGPYIENQVFCEHLNNLSEEYIGNVKIGGQFYFFQSNPFNMSMVIQKALWYGNSSDFLDEGWVFGFDFTSYPVVPAAFEYKVSWGSYSDNVSIFEQNLLAGIFRGPFEYYLGWKYMSIYNSVTNNVTDRFNGASAGVKYFF